MQNKPENDEISTSGKKNLSELVDKLIKIIGGGDDLEVKKTIREINDYTNDLIKENVSGGGSIELINNYYIEKIGNKEGYVKLGNEKKSEDRVIFDKVGDITLLNGQLYYYAELNGKCGYVKLGNEKKSEDSVIFDKVGDIGKGYYYAELNGKCGYIKLGDEHNRKECIIFDDVDTLGGLDYRGEERLFYNVKNNGKFGLMGYGNEKNEDIIKDIIFDKIGTLSQIKKICGELVYPAELNGEMGFAIYGNENYLRKHFFKFDKITSIYGRIIRGGRRDEYICYYSDVKEDGRDGYIIFQEYIQKGFIYVYSKRDNTGKLNDKYYEDYIILRDWKEKKREYCAERDDPNWGGSRYNKGGL